MRICWPNRAKVAMTRVATATACQAAWLRWRALQSAVMARKIGTVPTGSVITSRVTKLLARKNVSIIGVGGLAGRRPDDSMRPAPRKAWPAPPRGRSDHRFELRTQLLVTCFIGSLLRLG